MATDQKLQNIKALALAYSQYTGRQTLATLRSSVTSLLKQNPCLKFRLQAVFDECKLSLDLVGVSI